MDGVFRLGMVNQHKDLLKPGDQCIGGGYYHFDYTSNRIKVQKGTMVLPLRSVVSTKASIGGTIVPNVFVID